MDALVVDALKKWPNVPACYGWLALDGRGRWRIGQERSLISNAAMNAFIARNYLADHDGNWMFQNGPQRVYVDIACMPFVWQVFESADRQWLVDQCGHSADAIEAVWLDDCGRFIFLAEGRAGVVHDHDGEQIVDRLCDSQGKRLDSEVAASLIAAYLVHDDSVALYLAIAGKPALRIETIRASSLEARFGFNAHPVEPDLTV